MTNLHTLGPAGSYSDIIANKLNKSLKLEIKYQNTIAEVLEASMKEGYGIVPIGNNNGGPVEVSIDKIRELQDVIHFLGITQLKIEHCLAANHNEDVKDIKKVFSHPQGLIQSAYFLSQTDMEQVATSSTTAMIGKLKDKEAVICSKQAAQNNNLKILEENIAPENNFTKFGLIVNRKEENIEKVKNILKDLQNVDTRKDCLGHAYSDYMNHFRDKYNKLIKDLQALGQNNPSII